MWYIHLVRFCIYFISSARYWLLSLFIFHWDSVIFSEVIVEYNVVSLTFNYIDRSKTYCCGLVSVLVRLIIPML